MQHRGVAAAKAVLAVVTMLYIAGEAWVLLRPDGSYDRYGFFGAFPAFVKLNLGDPLLTAGLIDLGTMEIFLAVVLANALPKGRGFAPLLAIGLIVGFVFPGIVALAVLFLLWRRAGQFRAE